MLNLDIRMFAPGSSKTIETALFASKPSIFIAVSMTSNLVISLLSVLMSAQSERSLFTSGNRRTRGTTVLLRSAAQTANGTAQFPNGPTM